MASQLSNPFLLSMENLRGIDLIAIDGRTDDEKLRELLAVGGENSAVDFKETLDLSDRRCELEFVKDALAMFNRYPGGYLVIGADSDGAPSSLINAADSSQFDCTKLADKICKYTPIKLSPMVAKRDLDGHTYFIIFFKSPDDGLPVPFSKDGTYTKGKDTVTVFRKGDIVRRNGGQNDRIGYDQWPEILKRRDELIREDERRRINSLIDRITVALGEKGKTPPLVSGLNDTALDSSLTANFEQNESGKIVHFINELSADAPRNLAAIEDLAIVANRALIYGNDPIAHEAIDAIYSSYLKIRDYSKDGARQKLACALAAYEIGAGMVLFRRWDLVSAFVNRQSLPNGSSTPYASWIRDAQVSASRNNLSVGSSDNLISIALDRLNERHLILPGINFAPKNDDGSLSASDETTLDLLCSFDYLFCLCVEISGEGRGGAYPACCTFSDSRVEQAIIAVFGHDQTIREDLFPGKTANQIARGTREVNRLAEGQAMQRGRFWGTDRTGLREMFIKENSSDE